ncbi:DsbA family oxidoreductase [Nonomuraea sp. CA-218870]|uniref:DsbA family oxidoreductase n=1 Tax=Nonomuraea corallina TaxID=2989783 RepID=A0ABT4SGV5_9ACTN|nr:DsbA family oxidoreductase [Nonomuraea corallina]MDA0636449.1 DsbA family oxidoreductase [Nonomuraea corallina]
MVKMQVEIWSDIVCPWCWIGKRTFEAAVRKFDGVAEISVWHRSFELNPNGPEQGRYSVPEYMREALGMPMPRVLETLKLITHAAAEVGLHYRMMESRAANSFDAHRLLHFADSKGRGEEVRERVSHAFVATTMDIADRDTLCVLGSQGGLDEAEVGAMLESGEFGAAVRRDEADARRAGISGVPAFRFNGRTVMSGALSVADLESIIADELAKAPARR